MPILGLSQGVAPAFIKLGRIKKGDRGGKNGAPRDLDHFRLTFMPGPDAKRLEEAFRHNYPAEPREINIRFAAHNVIEVFDASYECYKKGGLIAKASTNEAGAYWDFYRDPEDSEILVRNGAAVGERGREFISKPVDVTKPIYFNQAKEPQFLEPVGRLQAVIPELARIGDRSVVGFFELSLRSPRDIRNVAGELAMYDAFARAAGKTIAGVPFKLIRREEEVTKNIDGKLSIGKSWVCHITAEGEWGRLALEKMEQLALPDVVEGDFYEDEDEFTPPPPALNAPQPIPATEKVKTDPNKAPIDPLGPKQVEWAMKKLAVDEKTTRHAISTHKLFKNPMPRDEFIALVEGMAKK